MDGATIRTKTLLQILSDPGRKWPTLKKADVKNGQYRKWPIIDGNGQVAVAPDF